MNKYSLFCTTVLAFFLFSSPARPITIQATPNPAEARQQVQVTIRSTFGVLDACQMQVDFGEGAGWQPSGLCNHVAVCNQTVNHTYGSSGSYVIRSRSHPNIAQCVAPPAGPDPASRTINITSPIMLLRENPPSGVVGLSYQFQFKTVSGGGGSLHYRLIGGALPPGLHFNTKGKITGVPTRKGSYAIRVQVRSQDGRSASQRYLLVINQASLTVSIQPGSQTVAQNRTGRYRLHYTFGSTERLDDTLRSLKGRFVYGSGKSLGYYNRNMTVTMRHGQAKASETVVVPLTVLQTAQRLGLPEIRYERTFTADHMDAETAASTVIAVGTGFTVTHMRLYFGNNQGKVTLKRNQRDVKAFVDLTYQGAGFLRGYWAVGSRTLATVQKNLPYSRNKTITLDYPQIPPLPTHSEGSHRLRFVITQPPLDLTLPEAVYLVKPEGIAEQHPILLSGPEEGMGVMRSEPLFSWRKKQGVATYLIQFFSGLKELPVFSAYTKAQHYRVPDALLEKYFSDGNKFQWQVSGYDNEGQLSAQSRRRDFKWVP